MSFFGKRVEPDSRRDRTPGYDLILVAGTRAQAKNWMLQNEVNPATVLEVYDESRLLGVHHVMPVVYYGTWRYRKDIGRIKSLLRGAGII